MSASPTTSDARTTSRAPASRRPRAAVIVPARFASTRLPGKPLAEIGGLPMVVRVARRGEAAGCGPVTVATDDARVMEVCEAHGVACVMTRADHPSGSDRVHEALGLIDRAALGGEPEAAIVLQGDLPLIDPTHLALALDLLAASPETDIATLASVIHDEHEADDANVVKAVGTPIEGEGTSEGDRLRALWFSRARAPWGEGPLLHHVGLYAYRTESLARFVGLAEGVLERRERLEQLRALENGMRIDIGIVGGQPLGVDAPADLERARALVAGEDA